MYGMYNMCSECTKVNWPHMSSTATQVVLRTSRDGSNPLLGEEHHRFSLGILRYPRTSRDG